MKNIHILKKFFQIIITLSLTMFASIPSFADDICEQYALDEEGCLSNAQCEWIPPYTCRLMENTTTNPTNPSNPGGGTTGGGNSDTNQIRVLFVDQNFQSCGNVVIDPINCTSFEIPKCNGKTISYWYESYSGSEDDSIHSDHATICNYMKGVLENNGYDASTVFRFVELPDSFTCEPGTYTKFENSHSCESICTTGHYCPGGTFAPDRIEIDSIQECYVGSYQDETGQSDCKKCAPGKYQDEYGATSCKICAAGSYTPNDEYYYPSCIKCPSGKYQTQTGQTQCHNCTNKPAAGTYKSDETGIYHNNGCSWSMPICQANYYYDTTSKACSACQSGYYNDLKSKVNSSNVMCYQYGRELDLCKSSTDYTAVTFPNGYNASNFTTCTPNKYTLNIYAEYMHNGIIKKTEKIATNTLTYDSSPSQAIYSVYSGTQILNSTITNLNNTYGAGKYFAPTSTGNAYLEINGTKYTLQSNYSGGSSGKWMMYENDHAVLAELPNGTTIDMYLKIQTESYNVYMISSGVTDSGPGNTFNIHTTSIVQKKFGSKPSDGVTPNKSLVTTCISDTNYAYIPDTATPKYYECTNTNQTASKVANTSNGSATMFEPSKSGNNICIAYQMTTCEAGHSCNSCVITPCAAGYYQNETGKSSCIPCIKGYYQDQTGQTECKPCGPGKATAIEGTGATSCDDCGPGSFSSNTANSVCEYCAMGKYQDEYGQSECKLCDQGTISTSDGATTCTNCYNGKYQPDLGQSSCKTCPAGTVSANDNKPHKSCTNCYNGQYQPNAGQASCATCPSGSYTTNENKPNSECEGCGAGTYYNETKTGCIPCPAGTYQPYGLQTACFSCQDGTTPATAAISGLFTTDVAVDATVGATARDQCYINPAIEFTDSHGSSQPLSDNDRIYWRSTP